jgi:hypothetical protein
MRFAQAVFIFHLILLPFCAPMQAQTNPVPFIHNPLSPASVIPGSPGITIAVSGAGFVSGASLNWNGAAFPATVVSTTKLTASIPSSLLVTAGTIPVTVSNPPPGGGISNVVLFEITNPLTSLAYTRTDTDFPIGLSTIQSPSAMAVGYLPGSPTPLLSIADSRCPAAIGCLTEKAAIATAGEPAVNLAFTAAGPEAMAAGDLNGDGIFDLVTLGTPGLGNISVSLGNGDGTFQKHQDIFLPTGALATVTPVLEDFDRDGKLDLVLAANTGIYFLPGNGDGSFGAPTLLDTDLSSIGTFVTAGDFDGDGILDLAVSNLDLSGSFISILLGNGDGTFRLNAIYPFSFFPGHIAAADFNGDGKLDLAVFDFIAAGNSISILIGNGDGTFLPKVDYPAGGALTDFTLGDYNGDGIEDIAVADSNGSVNILLGNGDGTFQSHLDFATAGSPGVIASAEFSYFSLPVGKVGFAVTNPNSNTISIFAAISTGTVNPLPSVSSYSPAFIIESSGGFTLTINGANFVSGSVVSFGGQVEPTTFVNSNQLTAQIPNNAIASVGPVSILVGNPAPGGGNSTSTAINVYLPPPAIASISPTSVVAGSPDFTVTINGFDFVSGSILSVNGTAQSLTYVSPIQVTATIAASFVVSPGTVSFSIANPLGGASYSGGGTSATVMMAVLAASSQPTIGALSPASVSVGGPAFTLTISGSGFGPTTAVTFGSIPVFSAFQNPTQTLMASIPASAIATPGTPLVIVTNPGGIPSTARSFTVNNSIPTAMSISPQSVAPGSPPLTLSVTGSNFNSSSVIQVNGSPRSTTLVSPTSLMAELMASDLATSGALNITVNNPAPSGGTTSALTLTVADFTVSVANSALSVLAGQPANFTLAVVPSNGTLGGAVAFSISGLPTNASSAFSPASLAAGTKSASVALSISTAPHTAGFLPNVPFASWPRPIFWYAIVVAGWLAAFGCCTASLNRRRYIPQFLVVLLLTIATALAACGNATNNLSPQFNPSTGTPAGTYSVTVTAISGNASLSTKLSLTVN